ncbi:MAG: hypothetical protein ACI4UN_00550 [Muribaculaceae bacterium]
MGNTNFYQLELMPVLLLMLGEYVMVLLAVIADLVSGLRKARARGEARRSKALRRTVDKLCRYYNALFALSVIDLMQMAAVAYLRLTGVAELPMLPAFTLLGAICIAIIEVKSIYEKASEKEQAEADEAARTLLRIIKDVGKGDWEKLLAERHEKGGEL